MRGLCVFCREPVASSDPPEHAFPQWVSRALKKLPGEGAFEVHRSSGADSFKCAIVDITTSRVCADCNHHWMSDLDSVVSPYLTPAVLGNSASLPITALKSIGHWAVKTALVIDLAFGDWGDPRTTPDAHCRDLYLEKSPRPATFVFITSVGYDPATQQFQDGVLLRTHLGTKGLSSGQSFDGYVITWHFGYLGFQVVCLGNDNEGYDSLGRADLILPDGQVLPADSFTRKVWPMSDEALSWPAPLGLEQIGLGVFANQPPFIA